MLVSQLHITQYPVLNTADKFYTVLQFMDDYEVQHLPVEVDGKFAGLVAKADLLDENDASTVATLENQLAREAVFEDAHFTEAIKIAVRHQLSIIPVITRGQKLTGAIHMNELLRAVSVFMSVEEPGGMIVLEMDKRHFSFGEISRLIETNDAYVTQLNTSVEPETGMITVTLKINKHEISDIVATFQRYEYNVLYYFGEQAYENELKQNYDLLMAYLKI
jgi:acetoin utilization protein AcuB